MNYTNFWSYWERMCVSREHIQYTTVPCVLSNTQKLSPIRDRVHREKSYVWWIWSWVIGKIFTELARLSHVVFEYSIRGVPVQLQVFADESNRYSASEAIYIKTSHIMHRLFIVNYFVLLVNSLYSIRGTIYISYSYRREYIIYLVLVVV